MPPDLAGPDPALGIAVGRRAERIADQVAERISSFAWIGQAPSASYLRSRYEHLWFGTLLVARWLTSGVIASPEELAWVSRSGRLAALEGLSVVNIARGYLVWRDVLISALGEEALRVHSSTEIIDQAVAVVRATCDGNLMRATRNFDAHLREVVVALDTERRHLREATLHDQLTGLANRILLHDRLSHAMAQAERDGAPLAALLIDLDGFKEINDTFGHRCGDLVLVELGARLSGAVRRADTVARLGGDEFVVVLPHTEPATAMAIAGKLLDVLSLPVDIENATRSLWASIGIAGFPDHGVDVDSLLLAADVAMYAAKRNGGGVQACLLPGAPSQNGAQPRASRRAPRSAATVTGRSQRKLRQT